MIKVVAGLIRKDDKILIARRASHKSHAGKWEFPGGKVEAGESDEQALARELQEEFGIHVQVLEHFLTTTHRYDDLEIQLVSYWVKYLDGEFVLTDHDQLEWVNFGELRNFDFTEADVPIVEKLALMV